MIDIELNLENKEIYKIIEKNEKNIDKKDILEEIGKITEKIEGSNINIATCLSDKEDFVQSLLLYIENLFKFLLNSKNIDENKIYVSITIVTNEEIKRINKTYRNIDKITDVLSFPAIEKEDIDQFIKENTKEKNEIKKEKEIKLEKEEFFGDIVISLEKVVMQSEEYGHSLIREISYLLIHSFMHLLGYDHIEKEDEIIMRKEEEKVLNALDIKR